MIDQVEGVRLNESAVRAALYDFVRYFAAEVERGADMIRAESTDRQVRRYALLWKIHAIPLSEAAAFHEDPLAGLVDTAVLTEQMKAFLTDGDGKDMFGEQQEIARTVARRVDAEIGRVADRVRAKDTKNAEQVRARVHAWAKANPIRGNALFRPSPGVELAALAGERDLGAFEAVRSLEARMGQLTEQSEIYAASLPRLARWHVELTLEDSFERAEVRDLLRMAGELNTAVARIGGVADEFGAIMDRQREAAFVGIGKEREAAMRQALEAISREREAMTTAIEQQVEALTEAVDAQRRALVGELHRERQDVMAVIREERIASLREFDAILKDTANDTMDRAEAIVDGVMGRMAVYGGVALGAFGALALLAAAMLRR
jgi:hypothetical protein